MITGGIMIRGLCVQLMLAFVLIGLCRPNPLRAQTIGDEVIYVAQQNAPIPPPDGEGASAAPAEPQKEDLPQRPLSTQSLAHLFELISREPSLSRKEVLIYEQNLPAIVALDADPSGLGAILEATGLTEQRLTYIITKVGVGLSNILYPENPKLKNIPDFLHPSAQETELIVERLEYLVDGFEDLSGNKEGRSRRTSGRNRHRN